MSCQSSNTLFPSWNPFFALVLQSWVSRQCSWEMSSQPCAWCQGWARAGTLQLCLAGWAQGTQHLFLLSVDTECSVRQFLITETFGLERPLKLSPTKPCLVTPWAGVRPALSTLKWVKLSHQMSWYNKGIGGNQGLLSAQQNCSWLQQGMVLIPSREGFFWKKVEMLEWFFFYSFACGIR